MNLVECLGVLRFALGSHLAFKHAEIAKFETIAARELLDNLVQELLNDAFHNVAFAALGLRDAIDQFLFCDCRHACIPIKKAIAASWRTVEASLRLGADNITTALHRESALQTLHFPLCLDLQS